MCVTDRLSSKIRNRLPKTAFERTRTAPFLPVTHCSGACSDKISIFKRF